MGRPAALIRQGPPERAATGAHCWSISDTPSPERRGLAGARFPPVGKASPIGCAELVAALLLRCREVVAGMSWIDVSLGLEADTELIGKCAEVSGHLVVEGNTRLQMTIVRLELLLSVDVDAVLPVGLWSILQSAL